MFRFVFLVARNDLLPIAERHFPNFDRLVRVRVPDIRSYEAEVLGLQQVMLGFIGGFDRRVEKLRKILPRRCAAPLGNRDALRGSGEL